MQTYCACLRALACAATKRRRGWWHGDNYASGNKNGAGGHDKARKEARPGGARQATKRHAEGAYA